MAIGLWTIPSRPSHRAYNINNNKKKKKRTTVYYNIKSNSLLNKKIQLIKSKKKRSLFRTFSYSICKKIFSSYDDILKCI